MKTVASLVVLVGIITLLYRGLLKPGVPLGDDAWVFGHNLRFYDTFGSWFSAWVFEPMTLSTQFSPFYWLLARLGVPPNLYLFFLLALAGVSAFCLVYTYTRSHCISTIGGLLYATNQRALQTAFYGQAYDLWGMALLPLMFVLFDQALERRRLKDISIFALSAAFYTVSTSQITLYICVVILFLFALWHLAGLIRQHRAVLGSLKVLVVSLVLVLGLLTYQVLPFLLGVTQLEGAKTGYSIQEASFFSMPSFLGGLALQVNSLDPLAMDYTGRLDLVAGCFIAILAFAALLLRRDRYVLFFSLIALLGVALSMGTHPPFGPVVTWLWEYIPGLAGIRRVIMWSMLPAMSYTLLISVTLNEVSKRWKGIPHIRTLVRRTANSCSLFIAATLKEIPAERLRGVARFVASNWAWATLGLLALLLSFSFSKVYFIPLPLSTFNPQAIQDFREAEAALRLIEAREPDEELFYMLPPLYNFFHQDSWIVGPGSGHYTGDPVYMLDTVAKRPVLSYHFVFHPYPIGSSYMRFYIDNLAQARSTDEFMKLLGALNVKYVLARSYLPAGYPEFFGEQKGSWIVTDIGRDETIEDVLSYELVDTLEDTEYDSFIGDYNEPYLAVFHCKDKTIAAGFETLEQLSPGSYKVHYTGEVGQPEPAQENEVSRPISQVDAGAEKTDTQAGPNPPVASTVSVSSAMLRAPVFYMKLDEGQGSVAFDSSGRENHGSIVDGQWVEGYQGSAIALGGEGYIEVADSSALHLGSSASVSAWVKLTRQEGDFTVLSKGGADYILNVWGSGRGKEWNTQRQTGGLVEFGGMLEETGQWLGTSCDTSVDDGRWHHVAVTYDGSIITIYVDGGEVAKVAAGDTGEPSSLRITDGNLVIGRGSQGATGVLDEVRIHDEVLTVEEIKDLAEWQPGAVVTKKPIISWGYFDPDGDRQSQYQIQVWEDDELIWDTGEVESSATWVKYDGAELARNMALKVGVRVSDGRHWSDWAWGEVKVSPLVDLAATYKSPWETVTIYGNRYYAPHIYASSSRLGIVGGYNSLLALSTIPGFSLSRTVPLFLWQDQLSPSLTSGNDYLVLYDSDFAELTLMELLKLDKGLSLRPELVAPPSYRYYIPELTEESWIVHPYWLDQGEMVLNLTSMRTSGEHALSIPFTTEDPGEYYLWLRVAYAPQRGTLTVAVDGDVVSRLKTEASFDYGFEWSSIRLNLERGKHTLEIENDGTGLNDVDDILLVAKERYDSQYALLAESLQAAPTDLVYLYEFENLFGPDIPDGWDVHPLPMTPQVLSSKGEAASASTELFIPEGGYYNFGVRMMGGPTYGALSLSIDNTQVAAFSGQEAEEGLTWLWSDPKHLVWLGEGTYALSVEAEGKVEVDKLLICPTEAEPHLLAGEAADPEGQPDLDFQQVHPWQWKVHASADEPFLLVFNESYHPLWRAYVAGEEIKPTVVNALFNGFYIDKTGDLDITLEFTGQRYVLIGGVISGIALLVAVSLILFPSRLRRGAK
jgi:hypothetical protein